MAVVLDLLLGGLCLMASRYQPLASAPGAGLEQACPGRHLALGLLLLAAGLAQLTAAVLVLRRRGPRGPLFLATGAAAAAGAVLLIEGPLTTMALSLGLTVAALCAVALGAYRGRRPPTEPM